MDNDKLKQFITAIGSMAEMTAIYYNTLRNARVPQSIALQLTKTFIEVFIKSSINQVQGD